MAAGRSTALSVSCWRISERAREDDSGSYRYGRGNSGVA